MERIVDTKIVLREITTPDGLLRTGIQTEKLQRLTVKTVEEAQAAAMGMDTEPQAPTGGPGGPSRVRPSPVAARGGYGRNRGRKSPAGTSNTRGGTPIQRKSREPAYKVTKPNGTRRPNRRSDMFSVAEEEPTTSWGHQAQTVRPFQAISQDASGESVMIGDLPGTEEMVGCTDESKELYMD